MINRRSLILTVMCIFAAMMLPGCNVFKFGRKVPVQPPPVFQSPIHEPQGRPGMTLNEIVDVLGDRQADTRSILGQLSVTVGTQRSRSRQQFDANMYFAPPGFLRVRGAADQGTLFDFLMKDGQVQVMVAPEKKIYTGTQAALRGNSSLMAGIQPDDLMYSFLVEQRLYHLLKDFAGATLQETPDHYIINVRYATGMAENYHLRKIDLLVDRLERYNGRQMTGSVRFDSYQFYTKEDSKIRHLMPNRFEAQLPSGAVATVEAVDLQPNAPRNEELTRINVPPDFQRAPL